MKAASSFTKDLGRLGPPFLHWSPESAETLEAAIKAGVDGALVVRRIDGAAARNFEELGCELGRAFGRSIAGNQAALDDAMADVHWHGGNRAPTATVYVVENAVALLRDLPAGMAVWGTKAESWAHAWAQSVDEGESWDHEPVPLHFIHCASVLLRDMPNMNRFEIGKP